MMNAEQFSVSLSFRLGIPDKCANRRVLAARTVAAARSGDLLSLARENASYRRRMHAASYAALFSHSSHANVSDRCDSPLTPGLS